MAMPVTTSASEWGDSPIGTVTMATATGRGSEVRCRKSQPPSRVKVSESVCTNSGQFDRVGEVDKIRTYSVVYRDAPVQRLIRARTRPRILGPRHDWPHAARAAAPVRARDAGCGALRESRMAEPRRVGEGPRGRPDDSRR